MRAVVIRPRRCQIRSAGKPTEDETQRDVIRWMSIAVDGYAGGRHRGRRERHRSPVSTRVVVGQATRGTGHRGQVRVRIGRVEVHMVHAGRVRPIDRDAHPND